MLCMYMIVMHSEKAFIVGNWALTKLMLFRLQFEPFGKLVTEQQYL